MNDQGTSVDSPTSLGDEVGALLGDSSWSDSDGPSSSDAAGDTPAERQDSPADTQVPEGTTDAERAGAPPADAAESQPDPSTTQDPTADEDILAGAVPLAYTVNGESRAFDGIQVLKDNAGAIVSPEALQLLTRRLGERDHLFEQDQARGKKYSDLEKLTEWRIQGADGKESVLTGREAVEASRVQLGHALAESKMYRDLLSDPMKLAGMLVHMGEGKFEHDPDRFALFNERLSNLKTAVESNVRRNIGQMATQLAQPPAPPSALTPEQTADLAPQAVDFAASISQITNLTPESKELLTELAPRYLRVATAEDIKENPQLKPGQPVVDAAFTAVVKRIHAQQAKAATVVAVNQAAAQTNAAKMAAALRGQRPKTQSPTITREPDPEASRSDELWALQERAVSGGRRSA